MVCDVYDIIKHITNKQRVFYDVFRFSAGSTLYGFEFAFNKKSIMFLVLAMLSSAAGRFGGTNIGGKYQVAQEFLFDLVESSALTVFQKIIGRGPFPHIFFHLIGHISCVLGLWKSAWCFPFWGLTKKRNKNTHKTHKKEKKRGGSADWLNCHGDAFAPQWSHFLQITQFATLPTSGGSITDAMIQPLPPLLTQMIEAWLLMAEENGAWNVFRVVFEGVMRMSIFGFGHVPNVIKSLEFARC